MAKLSKTSGQSLANALFQQAVQALRGGDGARAQDLASQLLAQHPGHPGALQVLAELAFQGGDPLRTVELLEQVPKSAQDVNVMANLGSAYILLDDLTRAEKCLRRALTLAPQMTRLHFNLGIVLRKRGDLAGALACYRRSLALEPRLLEARVNLANTLKDMDRAEEGEPLAREAVGLAPDRPELRINLAQILQAQGKLAEAEHSFRSALDLNPGMISGWLGLAEICDAQGRGEQVAAYLEQALTLEPDRPEASFGLASLLARRGRAAEAIAHYRKGLAADPYLYEGWASLAELLDGEGREAEAAACYERFMALPPTKPEHWVRRGSAAYTFGDIEAAAADYAQALSFSPHRSDWASALLMMKSYRTDVSKQQLFAAHLEWAKRYAEPHLKEIEPHVIAADGGKRLRVGYVSGDLRRHSVSYFIEPVLRAHDRERFEIFIYSTSDIADAVTARMRLLPVQWCDAHGMNDEALARRIRDDGIDLLVDLSGHTAPNRLLVFARKPAPVQITWIGYNNTTGMRQMDYRLTDALADPPGEADRWYAEKLIRLPGCFCCYQPPQEAPLVGPLPALARGSITFGCFNNADKVSAPVVELWARILCAVPASRLVLKSFRRLGAAREKELVGRFQSRGVDPQRIEFQRRDRTTAEHLAQYAGIDIALDTFPYNGVTTTCEALWMGVPVVCVAGDTHAGRVAATLLPHAGVPELVAEGPDGYVSLAAALAADLPRLEQYRRSLRDTLARSPLCDAEGFTRALEVTYRELWRHRCIPVNAP